MKESEIEFQVVKTNKKTTNISQGLGGGKKEKERDKTGE